MDKDHDNGRAANRRCDNLPRNLCFCIGPNLDSNQAQVRSTRRDGVITSLLMQINRTSLLVDLAIVLALILVGVVGYKLSPLLLPRADVLVEPEPGCDLHRAACRAQLPEGRRLELSIEPRPIPVTTPFELNVRFEGGAVDRVAIDFAGVDMNMGYNRTALHDDGAGRFSGRAILPVCITGRMNWQATLLIETGRQRIAVPFRFAAGH